MKNPNPAGPQALSVIHLATPPHLEAEGWSNLFRVARYGETRGTYLQHARGEERFEDFAEVDDEDDALEVLASCTLEDFA